MTAAAQTTQDKTHRRSTQLLNASVSYARLILRRYGEIAPFGFVLDREGEVYRQTLELPRLPRDPERLWKLLGERMAERARRGAIQALAMGANVTLAEQSAEGYADALILTIEHESGEALEVTIPYRIYGGQLRNLLPRRIALGKMVVMEKTSSVFNSGQGDSTGVPRT